MGTRMGSLDAAPVYIENNDLPNGFGFCLKGEDGVSTSRGNDPDDVNSWDFQSAQYYRDRVKRSARILVAGISLF